MKRMKTAAMIATAAILSTHAASAAELITNGGFENGTFTPGIPAGYNVITSAGIQILTGWTVGNSLVWGLNAPDINVYQGNGFVDLTGIGDTVPHGMLNQTLNTIAGQDYTFSVYTTLDTSAPSAIGITATANGAPIALSGTYGFWNYNPTGAIWRPVSGVFTATSASTALQISGQSGFSFMIGLDNVSVTGPVLTGIPEPSTWWMTFTGLAGLGFAAKRRRRTFTEA